MPRIALLALCFASVAAHASFELVVVADAGTGSIHRFDGLTGTYFGSFGSGLLNNIRSMSINQNQNTAFVLEDNGSTLSTWNYNTGEYVSTRALGTVYSRVAAYTDGSYALVSSSKITRFNAAGTPIGSWTPPSGFVWIDSSGNSAYGDFNLLAYNAAAAESRIYNVLNSTDLSGFYWLTGAGTRTCVASGNSLLTGTVDGFTVSTARIGGAITYQIGLVNKVSGCAPGHGSMTYWTGLNPANANQGIVARMDGISAANRGSFGTGILKNPIGMGVVVAPEPTSTLALAAGIGLLVTRRRRR